MQLGLFTVILLLTSGVILAMVIYTRTVEKTPRHRDPSSSSARRRSGS
jgi:uncharacterized membrane protein